MKRNVIRILNRRGQVNHRLRAVLGICLTLASFTARPTVADEGAPKPGQSPTGQQWALLIGCEKYHRANHLQYTVNDVRQLSATLHTHGGFAKDHILEMTDDSPNPKLQPLRTSLMSELPAWLKKPRPEDTILVYFSGHGYRDANGKMYLAPLDVNPDDPAATAIPAEWFRQQIADCKAGFKLLVIDACHAGSEKGEDDKPAKSIAASKDLGDTFRDLEGVVTLASSKADEKSQIWEEKQQSLFSYWLNQGLKGHADADSDGNVDVDELYKYVSRQVTNSAKLHFPRAQTPVRIVRGAGAVDVPVVVHLKPQPLKQVLADMAELLADAMADQQLGKVGVVPEFSNTTPGGELLGAEFGSLGRRCSEELESRLMDQGTGKFSVVDHRRLLEVVKALRFQLSDLSSSSKLKDLGQQAGGMPAIVQGIFRSRAGRIVNLQCKLMETDGDDVLTSVGGTVAITPSEWGMFGHSVAMSAEPDRPRPVGTTPAQPIEDQVIGDMDERAKGPHPLADPKFPYRVRIMVDGKDRVGTFQGNDYIVPLKKGEAYQVWIENRSGRLAMMRLLVDGLNTLPEMDANASAKVDKTRGIVTTVIGKRVDLGAARPWILDPDDPRSVKVQGVPTWAVRGFVTETGTQGTYRDFKVVDAGESLAARQHFTDQVGLITAAFYLPAGSRDALGTGLGEEHTDDFIERGGLQVGNLLAIVNIRYGDAAAPTAGHSPAGPSNPTTVVP